MPTFHPLPAPGSLPIEDALKAGQKYITIPARIILFTGFITCILLPLLGFSLWFVPGCFFGGILLSFLFTLWMTPRWRIWAYSGVQNIHLFQRSAELDRLLPRQSHDQMYDIMGLRQREILKQLFSRFAEEIPFSDDPGVGIDSYVFKQEFWPIPASKTPFIIISNSGINLKKFGFYGWNEISHEGVVTKSYGSSGISHRRRNSRSGGRDTLFFVCPDGHVEIPMSTLAIKSSSLDYILTLHRWRYEQTSRSEVQNRID